MENKEWDEQLRQKLNGLQPTYDPRSWEALEQRLESESSEAAAEIDEVVSRSLRRVRPVYHTSSWAQLAARLEREAQRRQALAQWKALELTSAFMLLLLLWQVFPGTSRQLTEPAPSGPVAEQEPPTTAPDNSSNTDDDLTVPPIADASKMPDPAAHQAAGTSPATTREHGFQLKPELELPVERPLRPTPRPLPIEQLQPRKAQPDKETAISPIAFQGTLEEAAFLGTRQLQPQLAITNFALSSIQMPVPQTSFRIGFIGTAWDFFRVRTPAFKVFGIAVPEADRFALGYSGGLTFSAKRRLTEYETGVIYSARPYVPVLIAFLYGQPSELRITGYRRFELNTLTIPLNFHRTITQSKNWRVYGMAGASLNLVLQANLYLGEEDDLFALADKQVYSRNNSGPGENPVSANRDPLDQFGENEGFLEGGSFRDNASLYGNFGLGLERYLNGSTSLFLQPTYQPGLYFFGNGLGPYNDRIHNFSIWMGMKLRL